MQMPLSVCSSAEQQSRSELQSKCTTRRELNHQHSTFPPSSNGLARMLSILVNHPFNLLPGLHTDSSRLKLGYLTPATSSANSSLPCPFSKSFRAKIYSTKSKLTIPMVSRHTLKIAKIAGRKGGGREPA
ncbi:hypothetical protein DL98DRAFT_228869 [Cadophora sp. DSE1049]|nr:hypothetical protein DL98DRAFT_228869 [Cadophora sp. DSE1049]